MTGDNFCSSAMQALSLIIRNPVRFTVVAGLGEVFVMMGRLCIASLTGAIAYIIIVYGNWVVV